MNKVYQRYIIDTELTLNTKAIQTYGIDENRPVLTRKQRVWRGIRRQFGFPSSRDLQLRMGKHDGKPPSSKGDKIGAALGTVGLILQCYSLYDSIVAGQKVLQKYTKHAEHWQGMVNAVKGNITELQEQKIYMNEVLGDTARSVQYNLELLNFDCGVDEENVQQITKSMKDLAIESI